MCWGAWLESPVTRLVGVDVGASVGDEVGLGIRVRVGAGSLWPSVAWVTPAVASLPALADDCNLCLVFCNLGLPDG